MEGVNVQGTKNIVDVANDEGVELFCHLSSVGVIGRTDRRVVDESTPCNPMNQYEATKYAAERIVGDGLKQGRVVILRPTNVFDAITLQGLPDHSARGRFLAFLKGRESTHFVYVRDVAAAGVFLLEAKSGARVETFIVSSDEESGVTHRDVEAIVARARMASVSRVRLAAPPVVPYWIRRVRFGSANVGTVVYSSRKLRAAGFSFPYGIVGGVRDAFRQMS
jgi:nucleoside-diphosphate-sugar epimerase